MLPELYPFTNPFVQNEARLTGILYPFVFQLWDGRLFVGGAEDSASALQWNGVVMDPQTGEWFDNQQIEVKRVRSAVALLLPDGTVLSTGSGARQGLIQQQNAEIYEPPYLFRGPRPKLAFPLDGQTIQHGQILSVTLDTSGGAPTSDQIQEAALIRLGSTTHQFDMAQRRIPLTITDRPSDELVELEVEPNPFDLPPGWYMLFILSDQGVPGIAPYVRVEES